MSWETRHVRTVWSQGNRAGDWNPLMVHGPVFSWFYRMWSLWCSDLWHLSRWPLIPRRKLDRVKAGPGCGPQRLPADLDSPHWCSRLRPCSGNLDIYPNGEKWHEVEPEPDRVMQWQSREMMRTHSHDELGRENKNIKPWAQLSTWISSSSQKTKA